jgi:hypothetical protein
MRASSSLMKITFKTHECEAKPKRRKDYTRIRFPSSGRNLDGPPESLDRPGLLKLPQITATDLKLHLVVDVWTEREKQAVESEARSLETLNPKHTHTHKLHGSLPATMIVHGSRGRMRARDRRSITRVYLGHTTSV